MVILGFMLNYALRVNLTIAIVAMVEEPKDNKLTQASATAQIDNHNDTFVYNTHSADELSSASHTLHVDAVPESFQNSTEKVSIAERKKKIVSYEQKKKSELSKEAKNPNTTPM